jgi:peptidyl-tRNA hydrolase, PTH1 family
MERQDFKLIVGLGNPGKRYNDTYHNIGVRAVTTIAGDKAFTKPFSVFKGKPFEYMKIGSRAYIKPLTFMNESGKAVYASLKYFGVTPDEVLVIHDDSDIEAGHYKLSRGGGSAGHNGIKSVIQYLGTEDFWRLRIGVRGEHAEKAGDFVLQKISPEDEKRLNNALLEIKTAYEEGHHE